MNDVLCSIVIPVYNRESLIERAINSCLRQSHNNIEVVVCDDHSTDATRDVVLSAVRKDHRIRLCITPKGKKGACAARNEGVRISKGVYVCFLDSDDELLENSVEERLNCFFNYPEAGIVYGDVYCDNGKRRSISHFIEVPISIRERRKHLMEELSVCITSAIMIRRETFLEIGGFNENQMAWQDDWLCVSTGMKYPLVHCGNIVAWIHATRGSIVNNKWGTAQGMGVLIRRFRREIVHEASWGRYMIWRLRLLMSYCYAVETNVDNGFLTSIAKILHIGIRRYIKGYFTNWFE